MKHYTQIIVCSVYPPPQHFLCLQHETDTFLLFHRCIIYSWFSNNAVASHLSSVATDIWFERAGAQNITNHYRFCTSFNIYDIDKTSNNFSIKTIRIWLLYIFRQLRPDFGDDLTVFLLRVLSMGPTPLISSGHVYHQFNTALKLIVWLIRGMSRRAASARKISRKDSVLPKINTHSESHKIFSMPICLQRPKEAFECGPGPLTHILNGLKCIQIISWKHSLEWSSNFMVEFYEYWPHWAPEPGALYLALTSSWH